MASAKISENQRKRPAREHQPIAPILANVMARDLGTPGWRRKISAKLHTASPRAIAAISLLRYAVGRLATMNAARIRWITTAAERSNE